MLGTANGAIDPLIRRSMAYLSHSGVYQLNTTAARRT